MEQKSIKLNIKINTELQTQLDENQRSIKLVKGIPYQ